MKGNFQEIISYIIRFLLGAENAELAKYICYQSEEEPDEKCRLKIAPSGFFDKEIYGTKASEPVLPLAEGKEFHFFWQAGDEAEGRPNHTLCRYYSKYFFLITRYEEIINRTDRDKHGRFRAVNSLPFRAGFLGRPIVDEYGKALRKVLREEGLDVKEPKEGFQKIYLTHDADQVAHYRTLRGAGGAVFRFFKNPYQTFKATQTFFGGIKYDPWFTFPWFFRLAEELKEKNPNVLIESIVFIKSSGGELPTDKPIYNLKSKDFGYLFELCRQNNVSVGLHPSYLAGEKTSEIKKEKAILDDATRQNTVYTRNHFLRSREPEDMQALIDAGLTDDFTMAYADRAGFRLGTCRPLRWINPTTLELTPLTLHPITMMDSTLSNSLYMNLKSDEAFSFAKGMIDQVKKHNGELVLLWHNTSVEKNNGQYHRELYQWMIKYLEEEE